MKNHSSSNNILLSSPTIIMNNFGILRRSRKGKKSKSLDDLSCNQVHTLNDDQKEILASTFLKSSKEKPYYPSIPLMRLERRKIPQIRSDSNLVGMSGSRNRLSADSVNHALTHQQAATSVVSIRKSFSCGETMKLKDQQMIQLDGPPKKKYLKRFEKVFRPIVGDETLYSCYSCALYQDSIATGHLYLTFGWFCFYSNFIGRQRQISIDVNKIQSITQQRTAKIIPNAIKITTDTESYLFSSFISRDRAYRALISVWRNFEEVQPSLSCEESDLSDVESMTRVATFSGYADESSPKERSVFEDSTSETSVVGADVDICLSQETRPKVINFADSIDVEDPVEDTEDITPQADEEEQLSTVVNNLQCTQWKPWPRVEKSLQCIQNVMQWCGLQTSEVAGDSNTFYSALIICTAILAVMTFYLGLKMFLFEKEQMEYMLHRRVQLHDTDIHYRVETTLELNHRLLAQITDVLSTIHKLLSDSSFRCCT